LFDRLRALRKTIAEKLQVPPFVVFSDATLKSICRILPRTPEELLTVPGVGKYKLEQYGEDFLAAVGAFLKERGSNGLAGGNPVLRSFLLHQQGKSIVEMADSQGLSVATVEKHLAEANRLGLKDSAAKEQRG
ncbi:MAG: HRDC domain-containing protein, partial [Gracilibacteraceae bacterium]|jgi:ATP-dependent DNA helicase RecQ|nr:HRDC domain-containing protein [Gracilibacteraceae bacterium]